MEPTAVLSGSILLGTLYIGVVYLLARYRVETDGPSSADAVGDADDAIDRDAGVVTCPHCGTDNELGYRYCYDCLTELPGGVSPTSSGTSPRRRGIL